MGTTLTTRQMIDRLIGFDTTSRNSNLEMINFVADYLDGLGINCSLIHDDSGEKANLFATIGPERDGGVVLSGHTDVVPVDGQNWASDPFAVREADGRLYGRGVADMKSFIAIALAMAEDFTKAPLQYPIHFAFSYDEEVGCLGVHGLTSHIAGLTTKPRAVIVGEPTSMKVVNAHKECGSARVLFTGLEAHSSAPHLGLNSIHYAAEFIAFLQKLDEEFRADRQDDRYDPPFTTITTTVIKGGTAGNIIPRETSITWGFRALDSQHGKALLARTEAYLMDEMLPRMREEFDGAQISQELASHIPALVPENDCPAETLVKALVGANQSFAVSYGTEAGIFQQSGLPAVVCGPGSIDQAHKADEFVDLSQIAACEDFMRRLVSLLSKA